MRIARDGGEWKADWVGQRREGKGRNDVGTWLALNNEFSPIIIEVVRKKDFASFEAFQSQILANKFAWKENLVAYRSAFYETTLTLQVEASAPPTIDGVPVNFEPDYVYQSPYLNGVFGSGVVTIQKGEKKLELDFNQE